MEDLRGRIDYECGMRARSAVGGRQVRGESNADLANQTLMQARDRFGAGVTDNIEVVQAQQLLASANENYIESLSAP